MLSELGKGHVWKLVQPHCSRRSKPPIEISQWFNKTKDVLTGERVVSFVMFINPPPVFSEYMQPLVELLHAVDFVILCRKKLLVISLQLYKKRFLKHFLKKKKKTKPKHSDSAKPTSAIHVLKCCSSASASKPLLTREQINLRATLLLWNMKVKVYTVAKATKKKHNAKVYHVEAGKQLKMLKEGPKKPVREP